MMSLLMLESMAKEAYNSDDGPVYYERNYDGLLRPLLLLQEDGVTNFKS